MVKQQNIFKQFLLLEHHIESREATTSLNTNFYQTLHYLFGCCATKVLPHPGLSFSRPLYLSHCHYGQLWLEWQYIGETFSKTQFLCNIEYLSFATYSIYNIYLYVKNKPDKSALAEHFRSGL